MYGSVTSGCVDTKMNILVLPKTLSSQFHQFIAYVAYPIDLFEEGSVTNLLTVRIL
jgi:ribulose 1,5-bisphosphate carboxylase large subunit-like protein